MAGDSAAISPWSSLEGRFPFDLCLVAEEIGDDPNRVIASARSMGINEIELGSLWGERIDHVPFGRLVEARRMFRDSDMHVRMVATQAFKTVSLDTVDVPDIPSDPHYREHMDLFRASIEAAVFFGAPMVRVFSYRRRGMPGLGNPSPRLSGGGPFPDEMLDRVASGLEPAVREAEQAGLIVALENVRSCWCDSGRNTARLLERIGSDSLRVIWDPANAYASGEEDAVEAGYRAVQPRIGHVHLKDVVVEDETTGRTRWERIGDGDVGLQAQLVGLRDDSFDGCISIETHWAPPGSDREANTRGTYVGLVDLLRKL